MSILELAKRLPEGIGVRVEYQDGITKVSIVNDLLLELYSFASTDSIEVISRVANYIDSLSNWDKFDKLLDEVKNKPLVGGVVNE